MTRLGRLVGQRPGHRDGLGRAAGEVEAGHRRPTPGRPGRSPQGLAADRVGTGHEHPLQVLFGGLSAGRHPAPAVEVSQAATHEHAGRGTGGGVVTRQGAAVPGPVAGRHRAQEVAVAPAQVDPSDRDQWRLPGPRLGRRPRKERPDRPGYGRPVPLYSEPPNWPVLGLQGRERDGATGSALRSAGSACQAQTSSRAGLGMRSARVGTPRMPRVYGSPTQRDGFVAGGAQTAS